jgi:Mismatch repair ATPase (MutS family)
LVFLHKVLPGPADKSYGIHVAKLAGLPNEVLTRADTILSSLEDTAPKEIKVETTNTPEPDTEKVSEPETEPESQLSLFPELETKPKKLNKGQQKVVSELQKKDLMSVTPIDAINLLYKWQKELK